MNTVRHYFADRLGRRGTLLALYGLGYGLYGAGQFVSGPATRFGDIGALTALVNSHALGWVWIAGGLIGVIIALRPRRENDGAGFIAVLIPLLVWMGLYLISFAVGVFTDGQAGNPDAWVTPIVWAVMGAPLLVIAGWPDPVTDGVTRE